MRWFYASAIHLWFIFTSQGSATTNSDPCSSIITGFKSGTQALNLSVEDDSITVTTYCLCEITTILPALFLCPYQRVGQRCTSCSSDYYCTTSSCSCKDGYSHIRPACISMDINPKCPPAEKDSCQTSTKFTINLSLEPSHDCSVESDDDFVINIILFVGQLNPFGKFLNATCNTRPLVSLTPDASRTTVTPTTWKSRPASTPETATTSTGMIIGIVVGVVGAVLIIAVVVIIVVLRRHRAKSTTPHAKTSSQATAAAAPNEAIPVSAAYDNATNASTLSYQSLVYDNKTADYSSNAYAEVKEPAPLNDRNCYDNSEFGRNEAYSMCRSSETGKDRDSVHASPSQSDENETTLIENEFYG